LSQDYKVIHLNMYYILIAIIVNYHRSWGHAALA